jgi:hypothetical protein
MSIKKIRTLAVCIALLAFGTPMQGFANEGGGDGGNDIAAPGAASSKSKGKCSNLAKLKRDLDKAEERVAKDRAILAATREDAAISLSNSSSVSDRQRRTKNADREIKAETAELAKSREARDEIKREYNRLKRACA